MDKLFADMELLVKTRSHDLLYKKPGAIDNMKHPKILWIEMLQHPLGNDSHANKIYAQQEKFNYILNNIACNAKHFTLSLDLCQPRSKNFDMSGNISMQGKCAFWNEFNYYFKKFDRGELSLHPTTIQKDKSVTNKRDSRKHYH